MNVVSGGANTSAKVVNSKYFNYCVFLIIMTIYHRIKYSVLRVMNTYGKI